MLAADAGAKIQCRLIDNKRGDDWQTINKATWDFARYEYRVEPDFKYKLTYSDGSIFECHDVDDAIKRWSDSLFNPTLQKIVTNE